MKQYAIIMASYWAFTVSDGALRMLVVLYFHQLGYSPLEIASLFIFYEFFGVVTNLVGGWMAARMGLASTLFVGLILQIVALSMLTIDPSLLTIPYVILAQALSGIAKDLNKLSAKSGVKVLLPQEADGQLYRWVSALTGSKNALKGAGFFLGGVLLASVGFQAAVGLLVLALGAVTIASFIFIDRSLGKTSFKARFSDLMSKSAPVNCLSGARFFLFGARDVWFVIAVPVYLQTELHWSPTAVGTLLALWIIGYGAIQAVSPWITGVRTGQPPGGRSAVGWGCCLTLIPLLILVIPPMGPDPQVVLVGGLMAFGAVFAVNSAIHSYLIVAYAERDGVTLDVGFYYMSNAAGRLLGTILSGLLYQQYGLPACLIASTLMVAMASAISMALPADLPGVKAARDGFIES
jgi:predicted MFS family arabinose efflux permease